MREDTANKLLKMIEEPPSQTVFILVSENPAALLETIRSRTQLFSMHRIAIEDIELALVQKRGIDEEPAKKLARFAEGSWLKALDALDAESENREFLTDFISLNRLSFSRDVKGLAKWSQDVTKYGREKQKRMLAFFLRMTRESFMYNFHIPQLTYLTTQEENFVKKFAPFMNENNVMEMAEVFSEAIRDIGQNANARIVFFDVALQSTKLIRNK